MMHVGRREVRGAVVHTVVACLPGGRRGRAEGGGMRQPNTQAGHGGCQDGEALQEGEGGRPM